MRKPSSTCILLGTILIFSLLLQGIGIVKAETNTNASIIEELNYSKSFAWALLLPLFFGCFLFLGWLCRYFEEMSLCFVYFISLLPAIILLLVYLFFPDRFENNVILLISGILFLISLIATIYIRMNLGKDARNKAERIQKFLNKTRGFYIIGVMLIWPVILIYFYLKDIKYVTFNGMVNLAFPVYIITASFIGVLSYLLLSIEETFCDLIPQYQKTGIAWSYLRRTLIAPFIAIVGFYLINYLPSEPDKVQNLNDHFVFVFSFFVGVFTKSIEEWIYASVQKLLPGEKLKEFESRDKYDVGKSELVKKLGLDEDLAYILYYLRIRKVEDLANCNAEVLSRRVNLYLLNIDEDDQENGRQNQGGVQTNIQSDKKIVQKNWGRERKYSKEQIQVYINKAQEYMGFEESGLVNILNMDKDLADKLYTCVNIKTIEDLSTRNEMYIHDRLVACNQEVKEDEIKNYIKAAIEYTKIGDSDLVKKLGIDEVLAFRLSYFVGIEEVDDLKKEEDSKTIFDKLVNLGIKVDEAEIKKCIEKAKTIN